MTSSATTAKPLPASPALAGLDGGVESEKIGLRCDLADHFHDIADLAGGLVELVHGARWLNWRQPRPRRQPDVAFSVCSIMSLAADCSSCAFSLTADAWETLDAVEARASSEESCAL